MVRRVLLTADTLGGVWDFALELARGLSGHGVEVALATLGGGLDAERRDAAQAVPGLTLFESAYRLEWMQAPWMDVARSGNWLLKIAASFDPDVVHLNQFSHGALNWPAPTLVTAHSCVYSWFAAVHGSTPGAEWHRYGQAVRQGWVGADAVTAPTTAMLTATEAYYGPVANNHVIPNGRRPEAFMPGPKQARILAVGRLWDPAKNLDMLARVAPRLGWPVRLVGPHLGPDGQRARLDNVETVPAMTGAALAHEFAQATIYALPARYEPFGLSVLEAALAGCALVLGDIPSLREVWGDAACYVPPDDDAALVAVLQRLSKNRGECQAYAHSARQRALGYSAAAMTQRYLDLYRTLRTTAAPVFTEQTRGTSDLLIRGRAGAFARGWQGIRREMCLLHMNDE